MAITGARRRPQKYPVELRERAVRMVLWWIRLDGLGRVIADGSEHERAVALLCGKCEQYRHRRPTGPVIAIDVARWSAWP